MTKFFIMADNISKIYEKAKQKGVLAEGLTEDMFRQQTATEEGLKSFYDYATQNGMTFRAFDEFKNAFYKKPAEQPTTAAGQPANEAEQQQQTQQPQQSSTQTQKHLTQEEMKDIAFKMQAGNLVNDVFNKTNQVIADTNQPNKPDLTDGKSLETNIGKANENARANAEFSFRMNRTLNETEKEAQEISKKAGDELANMSFLERMAYQQSHDPGAELSKFDKMTPLQANSAAINSFIEDSRRLLKDVNSRNNFMGGVKSAAENVETWDNGLTSLNKNDQLLKAVKKFEKGQELTEDESLLLDVAANYMALSAYYSDKLGRWYKAGNVSMQSVPFMLQFMATPIEGAGNSLTKALIKWGTKSFGRKVLAKAAQNVLVNAPAMTALWGGRKIAAGTSERQIGAVLSEVDPNNGLIKFNGTIGGQNLGEAAYNSVVDTYVENLSEMFFEPFAGLGSKTASIIAKSSSPAIKAVSSAMSKIGGSRAAQVFNKCYNNPFVKTIRDRAHFSGYLGEVAEEEVGGLLRLALNTDVNNLKEAGLDLDSQIDTFLGLAPTSILFGGLGLAGAGIQAAANRIANGKYKDRILNTENSDEAREEAKDIILEIISDDDLNEEQKKEDVLDIYSEYMQKILYDVYQEQEAARAAKEQEQKEIADDIRMQAADDGNIYPVTLDGDTEYEYRIASGNFEIDENGKIVSDEPIVIKWEDEKGEWKRKQVSADALTISGEIVRAEDAVEGLSINAESEDILNAEEEEKAQTPTIADAYFEKDGEVTPATKVGDNYVLNGTEDELSLEDLEAMGFKPTTDVPELIELNKNKVVIQDANGTFIAERNADGTLTLLSDINGNAVEDNTPFAEETWIERGATITPYNEYQQAQQDDTPQNVQHSVGDGNAMVMQSDGNDTTEQPAYQTDENGEPVWSSMPDAETFANVAIHQAGGNVAISRNFIADVLVPQAAAEKKQAMADANKKPTYTSLSKYAAEMQAKEDAVNAADAYSKLLDDVLSYIDNIGKVPAESKTSETVSETPAEETKTEDSNNETIRENEKKRDSTEVGVAGHTMRERFDNAVKFYGFYGTMTLENGTELTGRYVLIDAFGLTPSHDPIGNFVKKEGYPTTTDGQSINDRDYEHSKAEQAKVLGIAQVYDGRSLTSVPVVSNEGLVYGGNGRTMAGQIAAVNGTDTAYKEALEKNAQRFGFTTEQIANVPNARVVFMLDENLPYNTTSLAMFNENGMQSMNASELAQSITRKMNENGIGHISGMIEGHEDIEKFFQSNDAVTLVDYLISDGIISAADKNEMLDTRGLLSKTGQDVMSAIMLGTALQSDVIRLLENDIALRNNIIKALPVILKNKNFDENLRIIDEINNAIRAIFDMRNYGLSLKEFMRQLIIETDENGNIIQKTAADDYSAFELILVEAMLSKKKTDFVNHIAEYNNMAEDVVGGQLNIFDEVTQKDDIINAILRINGKEQQDSADTGANSEEQRKASRNVEEGSESSKVENSVGGNEEDNGRKRPLEEDTAATAETETKTETAEIKTESEKTKTESAVSKTESAKTKTDDAVSKTESKTEEVVSKTEGEKSKTNEADVSNSETPVIETETPASDPNADTESKVETKEEKPKNKVEVSENRIVDDNLYLKNVEILRKALNNLNIGLNPDVMSAGAIVACYHIERGARTFVAYSKAMMKDLGEIVKPYLKSFYLSAMYMPEMQQYKNEMDSFEYVQAFDVETIKEEDDQHETAQQEANQQQEQQEETAQPQEEPNVEQDNQQENGNIQRGVSGSVSEPGRSDGSVTTDVLRGGSKKPRKESRRSDAGGEKAGDSSDRSGLTRVLSESEKKNTRNFRLERGQSNSPKTDAQRYAANMEAIRVLKQLQEEGKDVATKEQQEILSKFTGWGGLGAYFNFRGDNRQEAYALKELLTEEEYADAELSRNSAYYTPEYIIDTLWDIAKKLGFIGGNIAENSAGIGNILAHMPSDISERSNITATEPDAITSGILKYLYPDAVVHDTGYEKVNVENGSVDLAITNVPFVSGMRVKDDVEKDLSKWEIHNFCIAKNIRKLTEGGLGIFISTSATMDGAKELRRWIENEGNADVIGLFRLNSETFGGATVTSDIIVVRKRVNGEKSNLSIDVLDTEAVKEQMFDEEGKGGKVEEKKKVIFVNKYLAEHPENLGGEMDFAINHGDTRYGGTSVQCYPAEGKNQTELLNKWVESISEQKPMPIVEHKVSKEYSELEAAPEDVKEGGMFVDKKGNIFIKRDGRAAPFTYSQTTLYGKPISEVVKDYLKIKDALNALIEKQKVTSTEEEIAKEKKALNDAYDTFVSKYGPINRPASRAKSIIRNDVDFSSIASLENYERHKNVDTNEFEENVTKTDIFRKRVIGTVPTMEVRDAKDGVIRSMNQFGELNLPKIAEWLGHDVETTKKQILEDNLGYENPANGLVEVSYKYLSGNVREKLKYAKEHNENGKYDKNIEALEKVLPQTIPFPFIHFQLGSTWIPISLYSDYVKEKFDVNASFVHSANQWITNQVSSFELRRTKNIMAGVTSQKLGKTVSGFEIFMNAINNRPTVVQTTEKDYNGTRTITDKEASQLAANKADEMKDDFVEWVKSRLENDEKLQNEIETTYNDRFNAIVPMEITHEFMREQLPGMNPNIKLRVHQQQAVSRALMEPVMLAHEVGSGKTFTLIAIAMEMRRLGTAKKPIIIVQNATLGQFAKSAQTLYPSAKILTPSEEDKSKAGRKQFFSKIMYNDWDMIIIPQSSLSMIPDSDERRRDFIREKIEEKEATLAAAREARLDNRQISAIGREIEKLNSELSEISSVKRDGKKDALVRHNQSIKAQEMLERETDDVVNFDELGIDAILLDEAHNYKHLGFETTMTRGVKGIDPSYSKRSASLYLKCQAVFDKSGHKNVVFATGTPISNTAAEVWTFMKYLYPKQFMKDNDIYYFDDFVHNFGRVSQFFEWATDGKPKEVTRFASYINIPELARMWLNCTHTILAKEIGEIKDDVPDIEGGGPTDIFIEQSPTLAVIMQAVRNELKRFEQMTGAQKRENSHIPLVMYGIAKRAAIEPKLVMPNAQEDEGSKLNHTIEHTLKALKDSEAYRGTCAIFCDNYRRNELRDGKKVEVYNMFDDMVNRLVARGVKREEIVVMKSGMAAAKKEKIFEQVNNGDVRVIIGTTETLGTGVNIQQRLFFLAMMDIPDRPMDYLQRIGRIRRQGNLHKKWGIPVRILRFGVKKSLDVTGYQRLKTKSDFINSIMESKYLINNNLSGRYIEEEEDQGAFDNPIAAISGCQSQVLLSKAERELRKLRAKKTDYENQQTVIINRLRTIDGMNREGEKAISELEFSLEKIREYFPNKKAEKVSIDGTQINNEEELAAAFTEMRRKMNEAGNRIKNDFSAKEETLTFDLKFDDVTIKLNVYVGKTHFYKNGSMVTSASFKSIVESEPISLPATVVPYNVADVYKYLTDRVINGAENEEMIETAKKNIANREEEKKRLQEQQKVSFNNDDEIKAAEERVEALRKDVAAEMAEIESSYQDVESNIDINDLSIGEEDEEANEDADMFVSSSEHGELSESEQLAADAVIQALNDSNIETTIVSDEELQQALEDSGYVDNAEFSIRTKPAPKKTGVGYKLFKAVFDKNGEIVALYPPMIANPNGESTPIGIWLDADAAPIIGTSKTGRPKVQPGGKGTAKSAGGTPLAFRPGWHLGDIPYALQFRRQDKSSDSKERTLFPWDFVWGEVEYAADENYQEEAHKEGITKNGKFQHSLAGLKRLPTDGYYIYRTNVDPKTDPWIITGAMKVGKILTQKEVDDIVIAAGREPQKREPIPPRALKKYFGNGVSPYIANTENMETQSNNEMPSDNDGVEFLRTPNGIVYGWAKDGKIYLTQNGINPDTPVHEYAHLWLKAVKGKNRELYENIASIFSRSNFASLYDELDTDPNYSYLSEEGKLSEVVSRFSGKRGAEMMTQEADRIIGEHPTISNRAKVRILIGRAKRWLAALWSWVGENLFGIKSFGSAEEVADRVMYDLLNNTSLETGERDTHFNKPTDENTDWQEELDLSTLSPLTIREKVLDSIVSAASQHNATAQTLSKAVDIVNSRIRAIRKAMSAQKMTDRDAIKKLTKMATIFLKNGWINANDRRALSTMIATIGRATEKTFEENARDLLTAVTSAHLNHVKSRFNNARKLKAKKLNISGVAEVDKVDIQTRYMFEAFNDGINLTEDEIDDRINETYDKMDDAIAKDDSVTEMEMRNKVNGYIAAQRYVQTVGELLAEGVELKDALADAKNKSYSGVAHPILAKREAVSLAKEAVIDNMLDLAYAYQEITNELRLEGMAGAERATEFRRKLKDNMDKIRHFANSDMEGIDAGEYSDKSFRKWLANSIFAAGGLFSPMQALNSILKGLARKAPNGEGYLYDHFVRGFDDAAETEYQGTKALYGELDEKASEIMGKKMSWADMEEKLNKGKTLDLTVMDSKGNKKSVELTQGQLAYLYAVNKMNDGQMKLRAMGISSADMDAIEDSLTPDVKEAVDWLQDEFLPRTRVKYNKVHVDMFGTPMARIENYFPLRINKSAIKEEVDLANDKDGIGNLPGTVTGAIKERRRNAKPLDIMNADAFTVAVEHIREMEHWAAFCQLNRDANILLSYQTFKNRLANMSTIYGAGKQLYTNIKDAFKVAIGTYQPKKTKASAFSVNIAKGVSASKVSFRLFTAIKQLLSRPAFYTETIEGNGMFLPYFIKATATPATTFKWAMQNLPLFEKRISKRTAGDTRLLEDELDWKIWHSKMYEWCSKIGMSPNAFIDALTCAQGAYAIYKSRKGGYINRGMSEEEADKRALQDASIKFNETQQSSEGAFVSTMQIDKDLASVVASLFQNSTIAYLKRGTEHIAQLYNSLIGVGKEQQVEYLRKKYVRLGFNESDAIDYANTDYKKSIARNAFGIFVFGYFINAFWRLGGNMVYLLFGDDDDKKKDLITDSLTGGAFAGPLRGTIIGPGLEAALDGYGWSEVIGADLPIESDIQKNEYLFNSEKYAEFSTNIINMLVAMGLGFNPETITNIGMSIIDACDGDLEYANDFMTLIFTIMSVPESQIKELYIDELGTSAEEIQRTLKRKQYKLDEVAKEYARRRKMKASPIIPMSEEEEKKQEKSARSQIKRGAKERIKTNEQ